MDALDLNMSAVSFMAAKYPGKSDEEYRRHLGAFGITGMTGLQKMELLSGGQKSRVAFAASQHPRICCSWWVCAIARPESAKFM